MPPRTVAAASVETREERIETIMNALRPKIDETVRQMVERAGDVPEAEEFGAIDFEFRDAGQKVANDVRQARKNNGSRTLFPLNWPPFASLLWRPWADHGA